MESQHPIPSTDVDVDASCSSHPVTRKKGKRPSASSQIPCDSLTVDQPPSGTAPPKKNRRRSRMPKSGVTEQVNVIDIQNDTITFQNLEASVPQKSRNQKNSKRKSNVASPLIQDSRASSSEASRQVINGESSDIRSTLQEPTNSTRIRAKNKSRNGKQRSELSRLPSSTFDIDNEINVTLARLANLRVEYSRIAPPTLETCNTPKSSNSREEAHMEQDSTTIEQTQRSNHKSTNFLSESHQTRDSDQRQATPDNRNRNKRHATPDVRNIIQRQSTPDVRNIIQRQQPTPDARSANQRREATENIRQSGRRSPPPSSRKNNRSAPRVFYEEFWSIDQVEQGLSEGTLYKGYLRINKRNFNDSYVTCEGQPKDFYIFQQKYRNRALDGDVVVIELLAGSQLDMEIDRKGFKDNERKIDNLRRLKKCEIGDDGSEYVHDEDAANDEAIENPDALQMAKVVYIDYRVENREFTGTISPPEGDRAKFTFKCRDRRIPLINLEPDYIPLEYFNEPCLLVDNLFKVSIKRWNASHRCPQGLFHGRVGQIGVLPIESQCLLIDNGVTWDETFEEKVTDCLPSVPWAIPASEFSTRLDLRGQTIFTIDPLTAKDLDDAVHIRPLQNGNFEVGVHIADVSFFIAPDSALDIEAAFRATTVYLVQKAIPMLPRVLCEDLCSLNPGVDRLAFSVIWKLDSEGIILGEPWFGRTIIRSRAKLSYEHAQTFIEGYNSWDIARKSGKDLKEVTLSDNVKESEIKWTVLELWKLAKKIRALRYANGALSLQNMKLWFSLDEEGNPNGCGPYAIKEANNLIEEFMLLANMSVAKRLLKSYPSIALLRQHSPPKDKTILEFIRHAQLLGFTQFKEDELSAGELQKAFDSVTDPVQNTVLQLMCVRPMMRALYFCSGVKKT